MRTLLILFCSVGFSGCLHSSTEHVAESKRLQAEELREAELAAAELDKGKQKSIWNAENVTFALEWRFGPRFKEALKKRDSTAVSACFRSQFRGFALDPQTRTNRLTPIAAVSESTTRPSETQAPLLADAFTEALMQPTISWESIDAVKLRVLKIKNLGDKRWQTRILIGRDGKTKGSKVHEKSEHLIEWTIPGNSALESEPVVDRWTMQYRTLSESPLRPLFTEKTSESGLDKVDIPDNWQVPVERAEQYRFQVAVEDFNRDGYLDIAVAVYGGNIHLLQGGPELKFNEVSHELGLVANGPLNNFLAAWIDYDNDGYPDLLMGDQFYRNESGKRFVNITRQSRLFIQQECMGASVVDYDSDGRLDLYLMYQRDWHGASAGAAEKWVNEEETGKQNELWRNLGDRFHNVTKITNAGAGKQHTHSSAWFFYDDDHHPDLYTANDFGKNVLLRNNGEGGFVDASETSGATGFATSMGIATGDLNNDGVSEIYVANMFSKMGRRIIAQVHQEDYPEGIYDQILGSCAGNRLYCRSHESEPYVESGEAKGISQVGWAFAPAFADFDNDGLLDIYSTTGFMSFKRGKPDG